MGGGVAKLGEAEGDAVARAELSGGQRGAEFGERAQRAADFRPDYLRFWNEHD